jgi:eukaryotic-like serine/threonine-protein kinase
MKFAVLLVLKSLSLLCLTIPGWLTYTDSQNKFTMNYPKEWTQTTAGNVTAFLSPQEDATDAFQENVNLMLQDLSQQPMDLKQYTEFSKNQIVQAYGASAILSTGSKTIDGQPAVELVYNMSYQGHPLKIKQYWFIKGKIAYLFSYTAQPAKFSKFEDTALAVINSFKFF